MTTITASTTMGIVLNPASYSNPVVVEAGVAVSNIAFSDAVSVSGPAYFFALQNGGVISGSTGVYLAPGGSVTNAVSGSITGTYGGYGVEIGGAAGSVVNDGSIAGTGGGGILNAVGIRLASGGSITNAASGLITGNTGVEIGGAAGAVLNYGSIAGTGSHTGGVIGVYLGAGGSVTNATSASITCDYNNSSGHFASFGVRISGGAGTVVNDGRIVGMSTNYVGAVAVDLYSGGTLVNAGTIIGGVELGGSGSNLLVLEPGYGSSFVIGSASANNRLELASAASTGTVTGLGTEFTNFGSIVFDAGAQWFASGAQSGLAGPISGFAKGDTIELTGDTAIGSSFVTGILTLDLAGGGSATLDLPGTFTAASDFVVTNVATGADVTVIPCFCAGTHIATLRGETRVEALRERDLVALARGRMAPIVWVGRRHIDCRRHAHVADILPVRVRSGAFGNGFPARDLLLSPDHAVFVDGVLVPVRHLINGGTVVQEQVDEVSYYHVELAAHDVMFAEGLPCESYLDTGNRAAFEDDNTAAVTVASA